MQLSNSEIEMIWIDAWNDLYDFMKQYPEGYILIPKYIEVSKEDAEGWIQDTVYSGSGVKLTIDYYKGIMSIYIKSCDIT